MGAGRRGLVTALLLGLVACGNESAIRDPVGAPADPLAGLAPCVDPPASAGAPVDGAEMPPGATILSVTPQGPVTNLTAYVPLTPVDIRRHYESRDDLVVLTSEDEVFEAEILVSNGTHRTFVKAVADCQSGSRVSIVVAAENLPESRPDLTEPPG